MFNLFSEYRLKGLIIKNRVVMPPMVCIGWANDTGFVSEKHIKHYETRAKGGVGLIIIQAACVSKNGRAFDSQLGIWSDEHIEGLKEIVDICHRYDTKVFLQIHHMGLKTPPSICEEALGPSNSPEYGDRSRALTIEELHRLQDDFFIAAKRAKKAGMDGIEFHGAHGYLLSQFASPVINQRHDEYGGSVQNRLRFVTEIIQKVRTEFETDFIISYRMGCNEPVLEEGIKIAVELEKLGVDLVHVSSSTSSDGLLEVYPYIPEDFDYGWIVYGGTEIKKHINIPVIVVNGIRTPTRAEYLIENGLADFTAIGKDLLVDPEWVNKARNNEEINYCIRCKPRCKCYQSRDLCPLNKM